MQKNVHVAIALIVKKGEILLGWRDAQLHQGGCYEFPGGKIETGEQAAQAVIREVKEEVGMDVKVVRLFHELTFDYSDRQVHLYFYLCRPDADVVVDNHWQWLAYDRLPELDFPAANQVIVERLQWARDLAITPSPMISTFKTTSRLCYLRENTLEAQHLACLKHQSEKQWVIRWQAYQALDAELQQNIFAIHLNHQQLHQLHDLDQFQQKNVIAACHTAEDIVKANQLGCDAILLSPVLPTATHPEVTAIGWAHFATLAVQAQMPVYALGGMRMDMLSIAQQQGAYGIAGIRGFSSSQG